MKMKVRDAAVLGLVLIHVRGCATTSEIYTANERAGYTNNCSDAFLTWVAGTERAAGQLRETRGYDILEKHVSGFLSWGAC